MEIIARYVHGSRDSRDRDVFYIVDALPAPGECAAFCGAEPSENRNLGVVRGGTVVRCYKGFPDEVNNALLATYPLHEQADALLIERAVPRDVPLKLLSVLRKLLMELRHTQHRREARRALKGGYTQRRDLARDVDLRSLRWEISESERLERVKCMAFQLGQGIALAGGTELYTKGEIGAFLPALLPCLYRENCGMEPLEAAKARFLGTLDALGFEDLGEGVVGLARDGLQRRISLRGAEHDMGEERSWS